MLKVHPKGDRILIRKIEQADMIGSIVVPDEAKNAPQMGVVQAVGAGRAFDGPGSIEGYVQAGTDMFNGATGYPVRVSLSRAPVSVSVGDTVLFSKFAGTEVDVNGQTLFILREDEILGVVEEIPDEAPAPEPVE